MCGIIGLIGKANDAIEKARILLNAINNRGEQACGAAAFDGKRTRSYKGEGKVAEVFGKRDYSKWTKLVGFACIMQTLYSTIGRGGEKKQPKMIQPLMFKFRGRLGYLAHNGNLVNLSALRKEVIRAGYKFMSDVSDTEVIAALLSVSQKEDFLDALVDVLKKIEGKGAFSLVILFDGKVIGVRDQNGIRPLCLGKISRDGESYALVSEDAALASLPASRFIREIDPGEVIVLGQSGIEKSFKWTSRTSQKLCIAELIYFARPATKFFGRSTYAFREKTGSIMAKKHPVNANVVVPVPESGRGAADGFASASGIPKREGLEKSRYSIRTFMEAREKDRGASQKTKLQALPDVMEGKDVVLIEDSIFRASVAPAAVKMSRERGYARSVHLRICSPPACHTCHLGLDTSTTEELVASHKTVAQIRDQIVRADSLEYLTVQELRQALTEVGHDPDKFCLGCFTGEYPVPPENC